MEDWAVLAETLKRALAVLNALKADGGEPFLRVKIVALEMNLAVVCSPFRATN